MIDLAPIIICLFLLDERDELSKETKFNCGRAALVSLIPLPCEAYSSLNNPPHAYSSEQGLTLLQYSSPQQYSSIGASTPPYINTYH